jgi:hypothetical protein
MTDLADRLEAVAHMMDHAPGYEPGEVKVWRAMIRRVDTDCFERSGKLIARDLSLEQLSRSLAPALTADDVERALERLIDRGHLANDADAADAQQHYRLFLFRHPTQAVT